MPTVMASATAMKWPAVRTTCLNYDPNATDDDGSCTYPDAGLDCNGNCLADADGDGICDEDEVAGCADDTACNYDPNATDDDGSCTYPDAGLDCDGNCLADADGDGTCDDDEIGLSGRDRLQLRRRATGPPNAPMLKTASTATATVSPTPMVTEFVATTKWPAAPTLKPATTTPTPPMTTEAVYPTADNLDCNGNCLNDVNENGICDEDESFGCTDPAAQLRRRATTDSGSCTYLMLVSTVMETALPTPMAMESATEMKSPDAPTVPATTTRTPPTTTGPANP